MLVMNIDRHNAHLHPALLDNAHGVGQTIVVRFPAQQAAEQTHVGTLGVMRRWQRTVHIKLNQDLVNFTAHEISTEPADAQGSGTMRAGGTAHHGSDNIIKNTDEHGEGYDRSGP